MKQRKAGKMEIIEFTPEQKDDLQHTINTLKRKLDNLSGQIKEIPAVSGSLDYSIPLLEISDIKTELAYVEKVLREIQDSYLDSEYREDP